MLYLLILVMALHAGGIHLFMRKRLVARIQNMERDLQCISGMIAQIIEVQMNSHRKYLANLENLEERMMELSVPSQDSNLPLERKHQVLALARQGVGLEEIVSRLKAPAGEAELILNLGKYMNVDNPQKPKINKQVGQHG